MVIVEQARGLHVAQTLIVSGIARDIVVVDTDRQRAEGEAMDLAHAVRRCAQIIRASWASVERRAGDDRL